MSGFQSSFILERGIGVDTWKLNSTLQYLSEMLNDTLVDVPAGFETDFASIPRFFHRLLPKNGDYDAPAVVHDFLYSTALCDRQTADLVFLESMKSIGVSFWKRWSMYQAVHWFGWAAWNNHRKSS